MCNIGGTSNTSDPRGSESSLPKDKCNKTEQSSPSKFLVLEHLLFVAQPRRTLQVRVVEVRSRANDTVTEQLPSLPYSYLEPFCETVLFLSRDDPRCTVHQLEQRARQTSASADGLWTDDF